MKKLLASNKFWALPEGSAEMILRELALGPCAKNVPRGSCQAAGTMDRSSEGQAWEPALPGAVRNTAAPGPVRVIDVGGVLVNGDKPLLDPWTGEAYGMGYGYIKSQVQAALSDDSVKAVLLNVDSPGGTVAGAQDLADFIAAAAKQKPMAAFTNSLMASAAYWVGSATGRVLCTETAELGSIGVIMTRYDVSAWNEAVGLKVHVITSGKWKAAGHPDVPMADEEREYFKAQSDGIHAVFRRSVAEHMRLESSAEEWGDAQVFLGAEALNVGLASAVVSGLDEAVTMLESEVTMNRAELEAQHPELVKELLAEGYAKAVTERSFTAETFLSCVKPFMDEAAFAQASGFFESGAAAKLSPEQMAAMAAVVAKPVEKPAQPKAGGAEDMAAMLEGIQKAQAPGVPADRSKEPDAKAAAHKARLEYAKNM